MNKTIKSRTKAESLCYAPAEMQSFYESCHQFFVHSSDFLVCVKPKRSQEFIYKLVSAN